MGTMMGLLGSPLWGVLWSLVYSLGVWPLVGMTGARTSSTLLVPCVGRPRWALLVLSLAASPLRRPLPYSTPT